MKSLHITNAYHPSSGGIRTWYRQVLSAAGAEGWQSRLVVPGERSAVEAVDAHARIYHVEAPRSPVLDRRYRLLLPHRYLLPGSALRRILVDEQPDLVEIGDKYALPWLAGLIRKGWVRGLRRPVLVGYSFERMDHNVAAFVSAGGAARAFARRFMQWYVPLFDAHLAASTYTADELRAALRPGHERPVFVQPNGLEVTDFDPSRRSEALRADLLRAAGGAADTVLLLYAGRLSPEKNLALLPAMLSELARIPGDYRLVVAGSGPLEAWLAREAAALPPGRLVMHGQVQDRGALAALYASCDVFVHPNPREPFGIGPLEAMASGVPVVVPDSGGVLTYATAENAWIAPPRPDAFAAAVATVRSQPEVTRQRVARARETALAYDSRRMVHQLFRRYADLCSPAARPHAAGAGATGARQQPREGS